jgi:hypothetical protein
MVLVHGWVVGASFIEHYIISMLMHVSPDVPGSLFPIV